MAKFEADMNAPTAAASIKEDQALAARLAARGTPHFFINGFRLRGAQPAPKFIEIIDRELARAKANFALRHCKTGDRVHQAKNPLSLVAKMLRNREGCPRCLSAQQSRLVRCSDDHDAAREAFGAKIILDEFLNLSAPLADQADDGDITVAPPREH
jgi:hypothetical protein